MRTLLALVLTTGLVAAAPLDKTDWRNVVGLPTGEMIAVTRTNRTKVKAEFVSATADSLIVRNKSGETTIPKSEVQRVGQPARGHRGRNAAIGAGIGAGGGALIIAASVRNSGWSYYAFLALGVFAGAGALVGALTGALLPSVPAIYEVPIK